MRYIFFPVEQKHNFGEYTKCFDRIAVSILWFKQKYSLQMANSMHYTNMYNAVNCLHTFQYLSLVIFIATGLLFLLAGALIDIWQLSMSCAVNINWAEMMWTGSTLAQVCHFYKISQVFCDFLCKNHEYYENNARSKAFFHLVVLFWIGTNQVDFWMHFIVSCFKHDWFHVSLPSILIMATRHPMDASHQALQAFCGDLSPFIEQGWG